ncbi:MAG: class I SAM-dependent methyltransferase [Deltaproteobacteria bacterium]|nr:class I SAM-dependent methyltransferase [Deltaproteobacteria bacterium]
MPARYEDSAGQRLTGRHRKSFQFTGGVDGVRVLDVGCSYGWFEKWALENGCSRVIAIEPDAKTLRAARTQAPGAAYLRASSLKLPLQSASVEKAVLWEVLEHLPKDSEIEALKEINRVLKNGGCLYLSTPHKTFWACALDPAWWLVSHRHYSLGELKQCVRKAGFEVAEVDFGGGAWELF